MIVVLAVRPLSFSVVLVMSGDMRRGQLWVE